MTCPDPELLAALTEQRLGAAEREALLDHAAGCDDCRHALLVVGGERRARATARVRRVSRSWAPWLAAAAAVVLSIVALVVFGGRSIQGPSVVQRDVPPEPPAPEPKAPEVPPVPEPEPSKAPEKKPEPPPRETPPPPVKPPAPVPEPPVKPLPAKPETPPEPVPPAPKPAPPATPRPATVTVMAVIDRVEGEVYVLNAAGRAAAKAGQAIRAGEGLECPGPQGLALVAYPDRTRLELGPETLVRSFAEHRITVEKGSVKAEVSKQPEGKPLIFATPHGEAKVLGTVLRVLVDPDPKKGTRLEVDEGKVELRNAAGKSLVVEGGHAATAAPGVTLASKPLPKEEVLLWLDFEDGKLPVGADTGTVEKGPDRAGSRLCLAGLDEQGTSKIFYGDGARGICTATGDEVLSFDYWVDGDASHVNFNVWNRSQKRNHEYLIVKTVIGKWAHFSIRLADLGDAATRLKEGDWIINVYIQGTGGPPKRRFYVDNILIVRPRVPRPAAK